MGVVRRDDAGLSVIQATLGDIRADAELGEAGAYRSPKVMQRERTNLVFGKGVEVTCDAAGQQLWVHRPVAILSREPPGASAGRALQALELLDCRLRQRHSEGNAGLGSLGGNVPDRCLGLEIQLGPASCGEFRSPDSGQENQADRDTRVPRSLGDLIYVGEEGGELCVIEGPAGAAVRCLPGERAAAPARIRQSAGGCRTGTFARASRPRDWP